MIKVVTKAFKRDEKNSYPQVLEERKVYFLGLLLYRRVREINTPEMSQKLERLYQIAYPDAHPLQ